MSHDEAVQLKDTVEIIAQTVARMWEMMSTFTTKDDLKGFATKDDLKGFVTKDELKSFATKEDLRGFATKEDFISLQIQVSDIQSDVKSFKTDTEHRFNRVDEKLDGLLDTDRSFDKRIERLESKVFV
jgi:hypothetical protein